jgi:ADP-ribose pyrophosphatase YjhB (NUDIX family)
MIPQRQPAAGESAVSSKKSLGETKMGSSSCDPEEDGTDAFLWLAPFAPPDGYTTVPRGGMCLCAFLFVTSGERILLGKYAPHPAWKRLAGMEDKGIRANANGWTLPGRHLKFGEDPREAARHIGEEILLIDRGLTYPDPHVATFCYEPAAAPGEKHYDVHFFFEIPLGNGDGLRTPPWYEALAWFDIGTLLPGQFARQHQDVVEAWLKAR